MFTWNERHERRQRESSTRQGNFFSSAVDVVVAFYSLAQNDEEKKEFHNLTHFTIYTLQKRAEKFPKQNEMKRNPRTKKNNIWRINEKIHHMKNDGDDDL